MRTQISTNVSDLTRAQADALIRRHGYSLRDVVSIAIDRLFREEIQMIKVTLDRKYIEKKIAENFGGYSGYGWAYYLVVSPDGNHRIISVDGQRQWDPWRDDDFVVPLPAPYGDGSSQLSELAEDMLRHLGRYQEALAMCDEMDKSLVEVCSEWDNETWKAYQEEALSWYSNQWLAALNGEPNDLDLDIEISENPFKSFKFRYA